MIDPPETNCWFSNGSGERPVQVPVGFRVLAEASPFDQRVVAMVRLIPAGRVASYGRIAEWIGEPAAARAVGGALARTLEDVPAHRVVTPPDGWRLAGSASSVSFCGPRTSASGAAPSSDPIPVGGRTLPPIFANSGS